jgi:hypothetical protein
VLPKITSICHRTAGFAARLLAPPSGTRLAAVFQTNLNWPVTDADITWQWIFYASNGKTSCSAGLTLHLTVKDSAASWTASQF